MTQTLPGFFLLADSAFLQVNPVMREKVHTPLKKGMRFNGMQWNEILQVKQYSNAVVSARQAVEWGMRAIQGSFGRLRLPLDAHDKHGRQRLIEVCLQLHNLRTARVGINQIQTVYIPRWTGGDPDFFERLHATLFPRSQGRNPHIQPYLIDENTDPFV